MTAVHIVHEPLTLRAMGTLSLLEPQSQRPSILNLLSRQSEHVPGPSLVALVPAKCGRPVDRWMDHWSFMHASVVASTSIRVQIRLPALYSSLFSERERAVQWLKKYDTVGECFIIWMDSVRIELRDRSATIILSTAPARHGPITIALMVISNTPISKTFQK